MARLQGDYVFGAFVLAGILGVVSVPVGGFLVGLLGLDIGSWVAYPLCFGTFAIVIAVMLVVRMRAPEPPPVPGAPPFVAVPAPPCPACGAPLQAAYNHWWCLRCQAYRAPAPPPPP